MTAIRSRVLFAATVTAAASLAAASLAIYGLVRTSLLSGFDASLIARADVLVALVEYDDERNELEFHTPDARPEDVAFTIGASSGEVIASVGSHALLAALPSPLQATPRPEPMILADGHRVRMYTRSGTVAHEGSEPGHGGSGRILVGVVRDSRELDRDLWHLTLVLISVATGISIGSGLVLSRVLRAALKPLERVAADIATMDGGTLDRRVPHAGAPDELLPIVNRLNDLLARVERDVQKEKAFNAAIAHELRTPLGGLQSTLEVHLKREGGITDYRLALTTCHGICLDMNAMVERLLMLSKADAGKIQAATADTDLAQLARDCWREASPKAAGRGMRIDARWDDPVIARTDPGLMRLVLANLIDNAISHGEAGGAIVLVFTDVVDGIGIRIGNAAPGLTDEQVSHVFERFWRADQARTQAGGHYGLGMALCRDLVTVLGGSITARLEADRFEVAITIPRTGPSTI